MKKYEQDQFILTPVAVPLSVLKRDYEFIVSSHSCAGEVFRGRGCEIVDLTYIDSSAAISDTVTFAGTTTERALPNYLSDSRKANTERRLQVGRQSDPMADDRNHNRVKEIFTHLETIAWLRSLGDLAKVTLASLNPNGWWPSHFDFSSTHASKANIPIHTNPEAVSLSWNQRHKQLKKVRMQEGQLWFINTAFKHTSFNWGDRPRTFLLVTFNKPDKHKEFL